MCESRNRAAIIGRSEQQEAGMKMLRKPGKKYLSRDVLMREQIPEFPELVSESWNWSFG